MFLFYQTQANLHEIVVDMNSRQSQVEKRTDRIEESLRKLTVGYPFYTTELISLFKCSLKCNITPDNNVCLYIYITIVAGRDSSTDFLLFLVNLSERSLKIQHAKRWNEKLGNLINLFRHCDGIGIDIIDIIQQFNERDQNSSPVCKTSSFSL